ncbi:ABC transporter permease [Ruminococcus flavefaciens]|uniref:ABC transporter permease n=1 Tax=Ruminococcus flavefaciens TaxID=1265 RepID=UPI0009B8F31E
MKKAVGFTSTQLRCQLSLSLMPTTIIAAVSGSVLGYLLLNPLFTLILGRLRHTKCKSAAPAAYDTDNSSCSNSHGFCVSAL